MLFFLKKLLKFNRNRYSCKFRHCHKHHYKLVSFIECSDGYDSYSLKKYKCTYCNKVIFVDDCNNDIE